MKLLAQTPADALLLLGGKLLSAAQHLTGHELPGRPLTAAETAELRKVFRDAIDYAPIRINEGQSSLAGHSMRLTGTAAFVLGNTVYVNPDCVPLDLRLLVHEAGHVWQFQTGGTDYLTEAIWAQRFGDAYQWQKGLHQGKSFRQLDPEQQAELLAAAYGAGWFDQQDRCFEQDGWDYTEQLVAALEQVRAARQV